MSRVHGYIKKEGSDFFVTTWHGKKLGKCVRTGVSQNRYGRGSWISTTIESFRCAVDGQQYVGRNGGEGLLITLRPSKKPVKMSALSGARRRKRK